MSTKRTARHGRARSLAVSAWPLRFKVALAVAIPLLLAATLGGLQVRNDLNEASNSSASAKQVTVLRPTVAYLTAAERAMVAAQTPTDASAADLKAAVQDVQTAADELTKVRDSADLTVAQRYQVDAMLDLSRAIREANTETLSPDTWVAQLRQLQSGVTELITTIVNAQTNPDPRLELLDQAVGGRFSLAMQQALVATKRSGATGSLELFAELGVEGAAIDRLATALGDSEPGIATLRTENAQRLRTVRTGGDDLGGQGAYTQYDALITKLMGGIDQQLATSASDARKRALLSGGVTLGALLAAILLAFLVSRLLLRPLRKVREGARLVAQQQLPDAVARIRAGQDPGQIVPIDVTTHEEVGQLARAVDDMHRQAVHLASGEARLRSQVSEMFITLSRRNTTLVNQQLGLIETLEKDEEDPRRLESLFRLDHLAARMRRTADSLLILADAPTHATAPEDLTVADALQAATAGVQDYQRVRVGNASATRINDAAAADVVHLLTELVDNALAYSSPTTNVRLGSSTTSAGATIEVEDSGLGIPDKALADINETLRGGGDVTPDTARRMGLFVVSRLAQRHGITVALKRNPDNGVTATVLLPSAILSIASPTAAPTPAPRALEAAPTTPAPAASGESMSVEARINAAIGLPRRQPGAQVPATTPIPAASSAPVSPYAAPAAPQSPARESAPSTEPAPTPASSTMPPLPSRQAPGGADRVAVASAFAAPSSSSEQASQPERREPERPAEPAAQAETAATAVQAVPITAADRLSGRSPLPQADSEAEADTPIFRALRSAWLSADATQDSWRSSEIEAGWATADRVAAPANAETPVSAAGLPVRRPGTRLVPGGVTKPTTVGGRDPEAIRRRLAAHAAGVSRGRAAASTATDQPPAEESPE